MLGRAHGGFPYRTLVDFAVAEQHKGAVEALAHARGKRQTDADGEPMPERARRRLHSRHHAVFGMSPKDAVSATEAVEFRKRKEAAIGEQCVEREAAMALAQDSEVASGVA